MQKLVKYTIILSAFSLVTQLFGHSDWRNNAQAILDDFKTKNRVVYNDIQNSEDEGTDLEAILRTHFGHQQKFHELVMSHDISLNAGLEGKSKLILQTEEGVLNAIKGDVNLYELANRVSEYDRDVINYMGMVLREAGHKSERMKGFESMMKDAGMDPEEADALTRLAMQMRNMLDNKELPKESQESMDRIIEGILDNRDEL